MASFDIIEAAGRGYKLAWAEQDYLLRLASVPLLIKIVCNMIYIFLGWEMNYLRQALVMLPSYFADGWMLSHLVRLIFLDQRWPFRTTGDPDKDMEILQDRAMGIMRGTLCFVVVQFLFAGVIAFLMKGGHDSPSYTDENATIGVLILALAFFFGFVWMFRYLWVYIPAAVNYPLRSYARDLGGMMTSFYMMGVWLIGFLPFFFFLGVVSSNVLSSYGPGQVPFMVNIFVDLLRIFAETIAAIVTTGGVAYGLKEMIGKLSPSKDKRA